MKKLALLFFICLLLLSLASCGGNDTPDVPPHDPTPQAITIAELDTLTSGERARLTAVVEGTMGDKLYVSDKIDRATVEEMKIRDGCCFGPVLIQNGGIYQKIFETQSGSQEVTV